MTVSPAGSDDIVEVVAARLEATDIVLLDLAPVNGTVAPFAAGAHIDLHLGEHGIRQYSLINGPAEREVYRIAVKLEHAGRGGSRYVHEQLRRGARVRLGGPRNNFALPPGRVPLLFIAGGIGITPIRAMIREADAEGRPWHLHYAARSQAHAAFVAELTTHGPERVSLWFADTGRRLATPAVLADADAAAHVICCGPARLMEAVQAVGWSPERLHMEWFHGAAQGGVDLPFDVVLQRSGRSLHVPADRSLLDVLRENDAPVDFACHDGICGTCETRVIAGDVDHRDQLLSAEERRASRSMMVCVSRCRGELVLDL